MTKQVGICFSSADITTAAAEAARSYDTWRLMAIPRGAAGRSAAEDGAAVDAPGHLARVDGGAGGHHPGTPGARLPRDRQPDV